MAAHNELGRQGEDAAAMYLIQQKYVLLDRNVTFGHHEIDIVAEWWGEVVFVEVKTRTDESYLPATWMVDAAKKRFLMEAANAYLVANHRTQSPFRFDVITVVGAAPPFEITHIKHAFSMADERK